MPGFLDSKLSTCLNLCMPLLAYFKQASVRKQTKIDGVLTKPNSSLSQVMPISSIEEVNTAVQ